MNNDLKELLQSVIREELEPVTQKLEHMDKRLDKMDARLDRMENEQQFIKQAVLETNESLNVIGSDVSAIKEEQQLIKQAVMETNQAVQRLESIQDQQHRIIEMLSVRSIEHEAELRRIK